MLPLEDNNMFSKLRDLHNLNIGRKHLMNSYRSDSGVKGAGHGSCLSPQYSVPEQGPTEEVTRGKQSGSKTYGMSELEL